MTVVDVDRAGIRKSARALGDEGTNLVLLKSPNRYDSDTLDSALPPDHGDSPANGGWFPGPKGWLLLIEGLDEQVSPWLDDLAARLTAAGIEGTVTGAGVATHPMWARRMDGAQELHGLVGYRPQSGFALWQGWAPTRAALTAAVDLGMTWLTAHDAKVMAIADLRAQFWVDPTAATHIMTNETTRTGHALSSSYHQQRHEVRHVSLAHEAAITLSSQAQGLPWRDTVDELRTTLLAAPLDEVSIAMVSHRNWNTLLGAKIRGSEHYHQSGYKWHPERWDEFILDPCGIQILTNRHLDAANDLTAWRTTRLDQDHVLVEARDLAPWYATPLRAAAPLPPELIDQARQDFGAMILTPQRAEELGLATKPDPRP